MRVRYLGSMTYEVEEIEIVNETEYHYEYRRVNEKGVYAWPKTKRLRMSAQEAARDAVTQIEEELARQKTYMEELIQQAMHLRAEYKL